MLRLSENPSPPPSLLPPQLESEVLRLSENLREECTAVNALKRQLLEFSEIAERYKNTLKHGGWVGGCACAV